MPLACINVEMTTEPRYPELSKKAEQIKNVARVVERTRMAELSRDHTLKQQLTRSQGLGLSR